MEGVLEGCRRRPRRDHRPEDNGGEQRQPDQNRARDRPALLPEVVWFFVHVGSILEKQCAAGSHPFYIIVVSERRSLRGRGWRGGDSGRGLAALAGGISSASSRLCSAKASNQAAAEAGGAFRAACGVSDNPQLIAHIASQSAAIPAQAPRHGRINSRHAARAAPTGHGPALPAGRSARGACDNAADKALVRTSSSLGLADRCRLSRISRGVLICLVLE